MWHPAGQIEIQEQIQDFQLADLGPEKWVVWSLWHPVVRVVAGEKSAS
jgi:hypothetical protein